MISANELSLERRKLYVLRMNSMKLFFKYAILALGLQIALLLLLGLVGNLISPAIDYLFEVLLRIYEPIIILVARFGRFKGESAIIEPVWIGIAIGVVCYSLLLGFVAFLLRSVRR